MYSLIKFSFIELRIKYLKIYNEKKKGQPFPQTISCSPSCDEKSNFHLTIPLHAIVRESQC